MSANIKLHILVLGDDKIGKTKMVDFWDGIVQSKHVYYPRIPYIYIHKKINMFKYNFDLYVYDTGGNFNVENDYHKLFDKCDVMILCFKYDSFSSYANLINHWFNQIKLSKSKVPILLVEFDAINDKSQKDFVKTLKKHANFIKIITCNINNYENAKKILKYVSKLFIKKHKIIKGCFPF